MDSAIETAQTTASARDATLRLADLLLHAVVFRKATVRVCEAIAATVANRADRMTTNPSKDERALLFIDLVPSSNPTIMPYRADPGYSVCLRVAGRALSGALRDPTHGATRCHALNESPAWARGRTPSAWIGEFLFYSDGEDFTYASESGADT